MAGSVHERKCSVNLDSTMIKDLQNHLGNFTVRCTRLKACFLLKALISSGEDGFMILEFYNGNRLPPTHSHNIQEPF